MLITDDAYDAVSNGSDFYFIVLGNDADELIYATYFGSPSAADHVDGGTSRFDKKVLSIRQCVQVVEALMISYNG